MAKRTPKQKEGHDKPGTRVNVPKTIGEVVDRFVVEIDSLASTLPLAMVSIVKATHDAAKEFSRFLAEHGKPEKRSSGIQIDTASISGFQKVLSNLNRTSAASTLVPRSFLVALVSQYDNFVGQLIETILNARPEILNGSERTISFPELVAFGSLEAARQHIVEKEVESVLRESHAEHFEWLEKKFQLPLRKELSIWPDFIEITERRNLFVHSGGQVSDQYLKVCTAHKYDCVGTSKGDQLGVTREYFVRAHAGVFEIGVKLAHVLWRKLMPDQRALADQNLLVISYNLLVEEKYDLAKSILDFATEVLKTHSSADVRMRLVVNRAQAYKWSGDIAKAQQILNREDFSASSRAFMLAEAVLRENFERAIGLVKAMGANGDVKLEHYREWPLFKEFRKQKELEPIIQKIFKEPLNKISLQGESTVATWKAATNAPASTGGDEKQPGVRASDLTKPGKPSRVN